MTRDFISFPVSIFIPIWNSIICFSANYILSLALCLFDSVRPSLDHFDTLINYKFLFSHIFFFNITFFFIPHAMFMQIIEKGYASGQEKYNA